MSKTLKKFPALRLAILAVAVCLTADMAIQLTRETHRIAAIWPVNALVLTMLIGTPRREWGATLAAAWMGNIAANLMTGDPLVRAALLAGSNTVEILVALVVLGRVSAFRLMRRSGLIRFGIASFVSCAVSTAVVTGAFWVTGTTLSLQSAGLWFAADLLGLTVFTPILVAVLNKRLRGALKGRGWSTALSLALLAAVTGAVFYQSSYPLMFMPAALLALVAVNSGFVGAAAGVLVVSVIAVFGTAQGRGPVTLINAPLPVQILIMQTFLLTLTLISLTVGAIIAERASLMTRLAQSRVGQQKRAARERLLVEHARLAERMSKVGYWRWNMDTQEFYRSPEILRINGNAGRSYAPDSRPLDVFERVASNYAEEDRERVLDIMRRGFETGEGWEFDATMVRGDDGRRRSVTAMAACQRDEDGRIMGFFGVLKDLTEERAVLKALSESERQYRLLADNSGDLITTYTADGVFTYLSPSVKEMLGYDAEALMGSFAYDLIIPEDVKGALRAFAAAARSPERRSIEYRARRKDGVVRWLEARPSFRLAEDGTVEEVTDTVRVITERKEREAALAAARAAAESATAAKSEFLSNMSHEIRTPLNGVLDFTEVLSRTGLTSEQADYVQRIQRAGEGLTTLINDILDSAKVEAGRMTIEDHPFDLAALVQDVAALTRAASKDGLSLSVTFDGQDEPAPGALHVRGDEHRARQVLLNLLGNAVKFTPGARCGSKPSSRATRSS